MARSSCDRLERAGRVPCADAGGERRDFDQGPVALIEQLRERARVGLGAERAERAGALGGGFDLLQARAGAIELHLRIVESGRGRGELLFNEQAVADADEILVAPVALRLRFGLRERRAQGFQPARQVGG